MSFDMLAHQAAVNARLADAGRCVMHNAGTDIPARYLLELPIGNVIPLCVECCAQWRTDARESDDPAMRPVSITEVTAR